MASKIMRSDLVKWGKKNVRALIILAVLLITLPWTLSLAQSAWRLVTGAFYQPASIVVSADQAQGELRQIWQAVAQGYEKEEGKDLRLLGAVPLLRNARVKYIRIDHVFDGYEVVGRQGGRLTYNWSKLDGMVGDIVSAGAVPYFSLSYMPGEISRSDILDLPREWGEWGQVVAALVARYSRDYRGGLDNVIYEVWNEPDLFGGFKMYGDKNYTQLYTVASNAAVGVVGTKPFKIGGPATTGFYPAWVDGFYNKLDARVRIDFFSWHRYSADVEDFVEDARAARERMAPQISRPQDLYISEWGVNPERSSAYDGRWAAAHYLAVNRALTGSAVDLALAFEVQDGPHAETKFHGGWGMLTHPKFGPVVKKPRFVALEMLSQMEGSRLAVSGEGTYVTAIAARAPGGIVRVLVVNYDQKGQHQEVVPVTVTGLGLATYEVKEEYLSGRVLSNKMIPDGGIINRQIPLSPSEAVLITLTRQ